MGYLNIGCFLSMNILDDQIPRTFRHGPSGSVDILDRTKYQGPFSVDWMSQWMFWMGSNVMQGRLQEVNMLFFSTY